MVLPWRVSPGRPSHRAFPRDRLLGAAACFAGHRAAGLEARTDERPVLFWPEPERTLHARKAQAQRPSRKAHSNQNGWGGSSSEISTWKIWPTSPVGRPSPLGSARSPVSAAAKQMIEGVRSTGFGLFGWDLERLE